MTSDDDGSTIPTVTAIANRCVADLCRRSPMTAIWAGRSAQTVAGLDDLSPVGLGALRDLYGTVRRDLLAATPASTAETVAREVMLERLDVECDTLDSGWEHASLNVISSPLQDVRMVFDLMPTDTADDWAEVTARMAAVPAALAGYRRSLKDAAAHGKVAAVRQVDACARQCDVYAGDGTRPGYFTAKVEKSRRGSPRAETAAAATSADAAYGALATFLREELRPHAPRRDAVGVERYRLASRRFLGSVVDLDETYRWGWQEFLAIEAEMHTVADRVAPGAGLAGAAAALDADPAHQVRGHVGLQAWMQQLSDAAIDALGRTQIEIPGPVRTLECRIAPPGGGVGAYYTGPSEDFSRPGRMWFSVEPGREVFSTWRETTTVYHEGVPGHHLQIATATHERERLNDFQRLLAETSGHCEGWALYAEHLMRELGYLDDDGNLLGMLDGQLFRAARVIVDIGMHLELPIPAGVGFHDGERWTPDLGLEFLLTRTVTDPAHCRDEIDRYLGWPGQAPAYKIGERVWMTGRAEAQRRHGPAFDLRQFHTAALRLGGMGLAPLEKQLRTL